MASPFNLFDFSSLWGVSSIVNKPTQSTQAQWATGGGMLPPTTARQPLPQTPQTIQKQQSSGMMDSIIPQANASENQDTIQSFLDASKNDTSLSSKRDAVIKMIQNNESKQFIEDTIVNKMGFKWNAQATPAPQTEIPQEQGIMSKIWSGLNYVWQGIQNAVGGAIAEVPRVIGNAADIAEKLSPWHYLYDTKDTTGSAWKIWENIWKFVEKYGAYKPDSTGASIWKFGTDIAATTVWPTKFIEWAGILKWALNLGLTSIADATKWAIATEGRAPTPEEIASFAAANTAFKAVWAIAKPIINTAKKYLWNPEEISAIQTAIKPILKVKWWVVQRSQEQVGKEIALTNNLIKASGAKPTNLSEYKDAIKTQMQWVGSEISRVTKQDLNIDLSDTAGKIEQLAQSKAVKLLDPSEGKKLLQIAEDFKKGKISVQEWEEMNQWINDVVKNQSSASETYKKGLQIIVGDIRNKLDETISNIPGQFKDLKKTYGALRNIYGDTARREIVYNRQNPEGLVQSISKIEGFSNIASGVLKTLTLDFKWGATDIGKWLTQNAVGRLIKLKNDPNEIIKNIFSKTEKNANIVKPNIPIVNKGSISTPKNIWETGQPRKLINLADEKAKVWLTKSKDPLQAKYDAENAKAKPIIIQKNKSNAPKPLIKKSSIGDVQQKSIQVPEGYIKNPLNGKIEKINQSKKGSLNIGQIGKDLWLIKKPKAISESVGIGKVPDEISKYKNSFTIENTEHFDAFEKNNKKIISKVIPKWEVVSPDDSIIKSLSNKWITISKWEPSQWRVNYEYSKNWEKIGSAEISFRDKSITIYDIGNDFEKSWKWIWTDFIKSILEYSNKNKIPVIAKSSGKAIEYWRDKLWFKNVTSWFNPDMVYFPK